MLTRNHYGLFKFVANQIRIGVPAKSVYLTLSQFPTGCRLGSRRTGAYLGPERVSETEVPRNSQPLAGLFALAEYCPNGRNCRDQPCQRESSPDRLSLLSAEPVSEKQGDTCSNHRACRDNEREF